MAARQQHPESYLHTSQGDAAAANAAGGILMVDQGYNNCFIQVEMSDTIGRIFGKLEKCVSVILFGGTIQNFKIMKN